jgi:hypothetical protein
MFPTPFSKPLRWAGALLGLVSSLLLPATPAAAQNENWSVCATEGQTCRLNSNDTLVRFGANGRYAFRVAGGQLGCSVGSFGYDPAPGVRKQCEVEGNWRQQDSYRDWQNKRWRGEAGWTWCANEGGQCRVPGPALVRYGANGRYAERSVNQSIPCHNGAFGDPIEGMPKQCAYRRDTGGPGNPNPNPGWEGGGHTSGLPWTACAREGESCNFRGAGMLRYGANGRYAYREAFNGLRCDNNAFGVDPAPGGPKRCEILRVR